VRAFLASRVGPRVARLRAWLRWLRSRRLFRVRFRLAVVPSAARRRLATAGAVTLVAGYLFFSFYQALTHFAGAKPPSSAAHPIAAAAWDFASDLRLVNTYHLFAQITRDRVEPTFETFDGTSWKERPLRYKPGPVERPPPFVAPHQPRVDFLLWFYGLGFRRGTPEYVGTLLDRMCHDRAAIEDLFASPLPIRPDGVRVAFYRYRFASPRERASTGAWWTRERLGALRPLSCDSHLDAAPPGR
jgi:hypothetical protein